MAATDQTHPPYNALALRAPSTHGPTENGEWVSRLQDLKPKALRPTHKPFKASAPDCLHIDVKYVPQMPEEDRHRYLFVAIDRTTRWGEGRLGIDPVDQFDPERAETRTSFASIKRRRRPTLGASCATWSALRR